MNRRLLPAIALLLSLALPAAPQGAEIGSLEPSDPVFRQLSADVEEARLRLARPGGAASAAASLSMYRYRVKKGDTLLGVAARCTLPYEALSTLNRIPPGGELRPGADLLIPATPGLFLPEIPRTDLELLMTEARAEDAGAVPITVRRSGGSERFLFYPDQGFSQAERAFFLNIAFRYPLPAARLTSSFGWRRNPVTGKAALHAGIDLAAPLGTEVYAVASGIVVERGEDPVYGRYLVVEHEGAWKSVYGHLSEVLADLRNTVRSGSIIGRVGTTGQSTGPHLHFELRRNGEARDPAPLIPQRHR